MKLITFMNFLLTLSLLAACGNGGSGKKSLSPVKHNSEECPNINGYFSRPGTAAEIAEDLKRGMPGNGDLEITKTIKTETIENGIAMNDTDGTILVDGASHLWSDEKTSYVGSCSNFKIYVDVFSENKVAGRLIYSMNDQNQLIFETISLDSRNGPSETEILDKKEDNYQHSMMPSKDLINEQPGTNGGKTVIDSLELEYCLQKYQSVPPSRQSKCYYILSWGNKEELKLFIKTKSAYENQISKEGHAKLSELDKNYCSNKYKDKIPEAKTKCYFTLGFGTKKELAEYERTSAALKQQMKADGQGKLNELSEKERKRKMNS